LYLKSYTYCHSVSVFVIRLPNVQIWSVLYRYEGLCTAHRWDLHLYVILYTFDIFYWKYFKYLFIFDIKEWNKNVKWGSTPYPLKANQNYWWNSVLMIKWLNWLLISSFWNYTVVSQEKREKCNWSLKAWVRQTMRYRYEMNIDYDR
jgi:hypothetical protein